MATVRIEGTRVVLRELQPEDHDAVRAYVEDPEVTRYLALPDGPDDTRAWLADAAMDAAADPRKRYDLAIDVDGDLVGAIGIGLSQNGNAEIGWALRSDTWGRGIAAEAARLLMRHAFEHLGVRRLSARCDIRNTRSARVMEKLFMRREAHLAQDEPAPEGGYRSSYLYALLADEWRVFERFPSDVRARCGIDVTVSRPAELKAVHDLQRVVGQALIDQHGMDHWAEPYDLDEMQADARRRETYAVHDASGDVIASVTIGLSPMWLSEMTIAWTPAVQPLWLHRLMVTPTLQSAGLGSCIMRLAEDLARARGCDAVRLETHAEFEAVQRFYARNGYVEAWRREATERHGAWNALEKRLR